MKIIQMIKELGGHRASIAQNAGITVQNLNNKVNQDTKVEKLASGDYVTVRKDAVYFKGDSDDKNNKAK